MFSIHKTIRGAALKGICAAIACAGLSAAGGCQKTRPAPVGALNTTPILVDEAMQQREWERSTAYYQNGDTVSGFSGRRYETSDRLEEGIGGRLADPLVGLGNMAILPVTMAMTPPWKRVGYQGVIVLPTHHANPPMEVIE